MLSSIAAHAILFETAYNYDKDRQVQRAGDKGQAKCSDSRKTDKHDEKQNKGEENVYD